MHWTSLALLSLAAGCASVAQIDRGEPVVEPEVDPEPDPEPQLQDPVAAFAVAGGSACATRESGTVECWGVGPFRNIMQQDEVDLGQPDDVVSVSGLIEHACMLHEDGGVSCWGWNHHLQLGGAIERNRQTTSPLRLPYVHDAAKLSSGHHHVCVLSHDAQVSCWGEPYSPSLGPDTFGSEEPVPFALPDEVIVDVSASMEQVCAVGDSGRVWCRGWLGFRNHELADRSGNPVEIPMPIRAVRVEAGWSGACAWDAQGEAWCWAGLIDGQWPTRVEIGAVADMSYGYHEICALLEDDGRVWCAESPPDALEGQGGFTHIGVSDALSCAVHRTGNVACWGREGLTWTALAGAL